MNAVGKLQAAIDKLERIKSESTPGSWNLEHDGDRFIAWHDDPESTGFEYIVPEPLDFERVADAERIDVMTSTAVLDAQLAILRFAISQALDNGFTYDDRDPEIMLADAILGEEWG